MLSSDPGGIGVLTLDRALRIQTWNGWLEAATGRDAASTRGRDIADLAVPARAGLLRDLCSDVVEQGTTHVLAPALHGCLIACAARPPTGPFAEMQQSVTLAPLRGEEGIVGVLVTIEDVTARLIAERELVARSGAADWRARGEATRTLKASASPEQIAELLASLAAHHHDFSVLSGALAVLISADRTVVQPIIRLLDDSSPNLRMHAALALGVIGDADATPALVRALDDDDANVRFHIIEALGRLKAVDAVEPLARIAATDDFFLAFPAVDALAGIEDPSVVPLLVALLEKEALRPAVIDALAALGDEDCVPALIALMNDGGAEIGALCSALVRIAAYYETSVGDEAVVTDVVLRLLATAGFDRLGAALASRGQPLHAIVTVSGWSGPRLLPQLLPLLGDAEVQAEVTQAIGRSGRDAVPPLLDIVVSGERGPRIAAARLLGGIGDWRATPALVDAVSSHDTEVVLVAVDALAALGDPDAFAAIVELLSHPDGMVRHGALAAIHALGDPRVRHYAQTALASSDSHVREAAVRIAGYFGFEETVSGIFHAVADAVEDVRRAAIEQIPLLDDPRGTPLLLGALRSETARNRAAAAHALRFVESDGVESALVEALSDADPWIRYFSARSLGDHCLGAAAVNTLLRTAAEDPTPHVRIAALSALTDVEHGSVPDLVLGLAADADENVAAAALGALARVPLPEIDACLKQAIGGPRHVVRLAAADALARRATVEAVSILHWAVTFGGPDDLSRAALDGLRRLATSESQDTSRAAVSALVAVGASPAHRAAIVQALGSLRPECVAWMRDEFGKSPPDLRVLLVNAAARLRHSDASALLVDALRDASPAVRLAAITAIRTVGAGLAQRELASLSTSDPSPAVRRLAAAVCERQGRADVRIGGEGRE